MDPKMPWSRAVGHTAIYVVASVICNVAFPYLLTFAGLDLKAANPSMHKNMDTYGGGALIFWYVLVGSISFAAGVRSSPAHSRYWLPAAAGLLTAAASWLSLFMGESVVAFLIVFFMPAALAAAAGNWASRAGANKASVPD